MKAWKLFDKRLDYRGGVVEMVIWQLPETDTDRPHGLKYRLVYVRQGKRLVGYDNERSKVTTSILATTSFPMCSSASISSSVISWRT